MAHRRILAQAQLELLQRIAEDPPEPGVLGNSERVSVAALRRRGLARISGRGPNWRAEATEPGRQYLEQVRAPSGEPPSQANVLGTEELERRVVEFLGRDIAASFKENRSGFDFSTL